MLTKFAHFYEIPLPAGRTLPLPVEGRFFFLIASTTPIRVRLDSQVEAVLRPGESIDAEGQQFSKIEITPLNATDGQTVQFWAGHVRFLSNLVNQVEARTQLLAVPNAAGIYTGGVLAASAVLTLAPRLTAERLRRKAVTLYNQDPAVTLNIRDAAGSVAGVVRPGESVSLPLSETCQVANPAAAPVALVAGEIYWLA